MPSGDKPTVTGFVSELSQKAEYGIRGEKPLAVIATLKYLHENNLAGIGLLKLLNQPHVKATRSIFLSLARKYSPVKEPSISWDLIAGKGRELQDAVQQFRAGDINKAFSKLTPDETESLLKSYIDYLNRRMRLSF